MQISNFSGYNKNRIGFQGAVRIPKGCYEEELRSIASFIRRETGNNEKFMQSKGTQGQDWNIYITPEGVKSGVERRFLELLNYQINVKHLHVKNDNMTEEQFDRFCSANFDLDGII